MQTLTVLQNTESEFLGLMEDHFEGRRIRFNYVRPATGSAFVVPATDEGADGLVILGGGPWGAVSDPALPALEREVALARLHLDAGKPVIGIGLGAQVLAIAGGGGAVPHPLELYVGEGRRIRSDALNGFLPGVFPLISYMRDRPQPPSDAAVLAVDGNDRPALFQIGARGLGFAGHPGTKPGILEDLLMEFTEAPDDFGARLDEAKQVQTAVADALVPIMTGVIQITGLMRPAAEDAGPNNRGETV